MNETKQVPSVGRIVHYCGHETPKGKAAWLSCVAAIITEVYEPRNPSSAIALTLFLPGEMISKEDVQFGNQSGQWHWPEFVPPVSV